MGAQVCQPADAGQACRPADVYETLLDEDMPIQILTHVRESRPARPVEQGDSSSKLATPGMQGLSEAEVRQLADSCQETASAMTPQEVLAELQKGNARFFTGNAIRPERNAFERRALIRKQWPSVAVLGCSDSRVPTEIIFDVGLGELYVVRVAGNCLDTSSLASLQYAVNHLKVKVLVVMGHEGCGAVRAASLPRDQISKEPQALGNLLNQMKSGLDHDSLATIQDDRARDREAIVTHVKKQLESLACDEDIMERVEQCELLVLGAFYELSSGIVDFFSELTTPLSWSRHISGGSFSGAGANAMVEVGEDV
eukprot:TRINITY_DN17636_c0_g1_i1.p1 TRINITY_DN17636_c0_g1~~TRINITY_DN17636_c0_g1_i1.p1  ORF type:complete len:312 (-),score=51.51 TRINITY_DN17636_c0_g1_i1:521-1456(-)